jgi:oxygen-independent coproporphyrinogen III oxidase
VLVLRLSHERHAQAGSGQPLRRLARCAEIRLVAAELRFRPKISHLHWGGGTPTLLAPEDVEKIGLALREAFQLDPLAESAVEVDPRMLTTEVAAAFSRAGVNRASLGVQSFDPAVQLAINRVQSFATTARAVELLRDKSIPAINFDLVYGLPFQTVQSCLDTVEQALKLQPDRLAVFGYAHVPSFKPHQRKIDESALPDASERHAQANAIADVLTAAGYRQIGLDHFSLPGDSLALAAEQGKLHRNFQGYTTDSMRDFDRLWRLGNRQGAARASFKTAPAFPDYQRRVRPTEYCRLRASAGSATKMRAARKLSSGLCATIALM